MSLGSPDPHDSDVVREKIEYCQIFVNALFVVYDVTIVHRAISRVISHNNYCLLLRMILSAKQ